MNKLALPLSTAAILLSTSSIAATADKNDQFTALSAQVKKLNAQTQQLKHEVKQLRMKQSDHPAKAQDRSKDTSAFAPFGHYVTITTSPFLGKQTTYAPTDLLNQVSSNNEDLRLLKKKRELVSTLKTSGYTIERPIVELSGGVEGQAYSTGGFNSASTESIALSTAELDLNAIASTWASAFMSLDYSSSPVSSGNRAPNARIYLKRGFATLGNLEVSPVYGSIGLMYAPFGRYSSGMVTTPLTLSMARIRTEVALLGLSLDNGLYGSVYGFTGSQTSEGQALFFKQGGVNLGLERDFANGNGSYALGAGWVSNIADAEGEQDTGLGTAGGQFSGFAVSQPGSSTSNNSLVHRVGGFDVHGKLTCHQFTFISEYLGAVSHFNAADMVFNSKGARPQALHAEIDYALPFDEQYNTTIGVSYGETWEALALNLPKNSYATFISTSLLRDTIESIEYRHDTDYAATDTANGRSAGSTAAITGTGRSRNSVTMQVGVYF